MQNRQAATSALYSSAQYLRIMKLCWICCWGKCELSFTKSKICPWGWYWLHKGEGWLNFFQLNQMKAMTLLQTTHNLELSSSRKKYFAFRWKIRMFSNVFTGLTFDSKNCSSARLSQKSFGLQNMHCWSAWRKAPPNNSCSWHILFTQV